MGTVASNESETAQRRNAEPQLRHPLEQRAFVLSVALNVLILAGAVIIVAYGAEWLKAHPVLAKYVARIRVAAIALVVAGPATVFLRNARRAYARGNSLRVSRSQFPMVFGILEDQCRKLGMQTVPELYLSDRASEPARAGSAWRCEYIVLGTGFLARELDATRDVIAFSLGHELGRLRLGHATWWDELVLSYVLKVPFLRNPLSKIRTYSRDRYAAFLAPDGLRGLVILASGRRLLPNVDIDDYLRNIETYVGIWPRLAGLGRDTPHVADRVKALLNTGLLERRPSTIAARTVGEAVPVHGQE